MLSCDFHAYFLAFIGSTNKREYVELSEMDISMREGMI